MSTIRPINLRELAYSPNINPLLEPQEIHVKRRYVRTSSRQDLMDAATGELAAVTAIHTIEERDDAEFVKVFADGVRAAFDLSRTGYRVFQAVLTIYQDTAMKRGYAEAVELFWFGDGLNGRTIDMSEKTFQRGLKELLAKSFLAPKSASMFWVNPSLFFKGDRVAFVKEYRRKRRCSTPEKERIEAPDRAEQP
jgi:hypothetical protein